jgi:hypothetical protein
MSDKTESLTDTLAKQANARFSASAGVEKDERSWYVANILLNGSSNMIISIKVLYCIVVNHILQFLSNPILFRLLLTGLHHYCQIIKRNVNLHLQHFMIC